MNSWDDGCDMAEGFTKSCNRIHNGLIHEHEFVPRGSKGSYHLCVCCTTCRKCYCYLCGKLVEKDTAAASLHDSNPDI